MYTCSEARQHLATRLEQATKDGEAASSARTSSVVEVALEAEDPPVMEAFETAQFHLGLLTANLVNVLDPQVVVFGGGLVEWLGEGFVAPVARTAAQYCLQQKNAERIRIVPSALGDDAGPVGAAVVASRRL